MIKVLIVDDSAFMRKALSTVLSVDTGIEIVGTARDGEEALQKVRSLDPDVVTLDIEMPRLNGLETLQEIMKTMPRPVLMVSSLTEEGAEATLKAMELGALDFLPKSLSAQHSFFAAELVKKIKVLARKKALMQLRFGRMNSASTRRASAPPSACPPPVPCRGMRDIVSIGVSTGGPPAVQKVLSSLPANFPACILIAQHMPAAFTGPFAKRLDNVCQIHVTEAQDGDKIKPGHAYVAPGGKHMQVVMRGPLPEISITTEPTSALYKPSANVLMESVGRNMGRKSLGVILTGMGNDGMEGMKVLKEKGGYILAQNENSCVVYGMPKAVVDAGLADQVIDIEQMAEAIITAVRG